MTFAQPFSDYEILDRVGAGAMGTVFKARHKKLNRIVALKVLKPSLARDARYVDRLRREARIVASLNDPHIVTGYDLGEEGGYHFFVMEFIEGKSLRALLVEWGMFAEEYVRGVARQVAQALDHAYQRGVIHRDIKPGNILIDEHGVAKLTDMGLAKGPADLTLTRDGATVGTPQYISPEQARNPQDVDVRSDLYSLGATLYHMATGVPPFRGDTMAQLITNVLNETPPAPNDVNPALSEGLSLVIRKLLAKDLRVRYQTPRELLDDLDRIDRSLPPQVDAARLAAEAAHRPRVLLGAFLTVAVTGLVGGGWWLGSQTREPIAVVPTSDEFIANLDANLLALPTPGRRLELLLGTVHSAPTGTARQIDERRLRILEELQTAVDGVASQLLGPDWSELSTWLRDPVVWPDRRRCEIERIQPLLQKRAGVGLGPGPMPGNLQRARIDELLARIDSELQARDGEVLVRFQSFLDETLPARVEERLRARDFAGADHLWADAKARFFEGVSMPLLERLPETMKSRIEESYKGAKKAALAVIDAAEAKEAEALREEVITVCSDLEERLRRGVYPDSVASAITQFRVSLQQIWPASSRFRVGSGRDPWSEIERRLGALQHQVDFAITRAADTKLEQRFDLAWRTLCHGTAADALAVLEDAATRDDAQRTRLARHRQALAAMAAIENAMLQALARIGRGVVAFPRQGGQPVELRMEPHDGAQRLVSQVIGQPPHESRLTEYRISDLLARLRQEGPDPLQGLAAEQRALGLLVAKFIGDDLASLGADLREIEKQPDAFVFDEIWLRILTVRKERPEATPDRAELFANLKTAREAATKSDAHLTALMQAIMTCKNRVPEALRNGREDAQLREAEAWFELARQRRDVETEMRASAPKGATVAVSIAGEDLVAEVDMAASVLQHDASDGWHLRDGTLEFAGGDRPWRETASQRLKCSSGIEPRATKMQVEVDVVLPPSTVGRRLYVFEFRGVAAVLVVKANEAVHGALVEGNFVEPEQVQRAFQHALLEKQAGRVAIPGAVHRVRLELEPTYGRRRANVKIHFDGAELLSGTHDLDAQAAAAFVLYPQQEIAVSRVVVRARGQL